MKEQDPVALAKSILNNAAPLVARDLVSLTQASEDPDDHRRYLELVKKMNEKEQASGAVFHFTFDMHGGIVAEEVPVAEVVDAEVKQIEADDQRPANLPPLEPAVIDFADLLGLEVDE
jgi:hypothetical protein